jgi:hypothetical protein
VTTIQEMLYWYKACRGSKYSAKMITYKKKKKMNHVGRRANSILQKRSPHSGMHWLGFPIWACIDSHSCIRAYMDSGGLFLLENGLRHCVIKWCHSVKILSDSESAHQGLSFEVLHDIVPSFVNLTLGYTIFDPSTNYEGHQQSVLKINQLSARLYATFTPSLKLIQSKLLEK